MSRVAASRLRCAERNSLARSMRDGGASLDAIADALGVTWAEAAAILKNTQMQERASEVVVR